ncbi:phosphate starvation-inducible protein PhoH [Eubacterium sp. An11]|uniref:PhoH family protein n=1 Tax=Eubacterium sp. An11 TaxID=1965542 RepID=UPI000B36E47C|nr:PhoH family protein [Eubacterium sp. An11]OUQ68866.1 phosphate starvation-inducible protein PhoH [Eubacterium sp. An11]
MNISEVEFSFPAAHAGNVFGQFDAYMKKIERALHVTLIFRDDKIKIIGSGEGCQKARDVIDELTVLSERGNVITEQDVNYALSLAMSQSDTVESMTELDSDIICHTVMGKPVKPKTMGQQKYVKEITDKMIVFGVGPAGTGKTYLAMAKAITAFKANEVGRIILTRPAIEAGEKLGFLPGDLQSKVDPYLRPLYDALYEIMGAETFQKNMEKGLIEVAPLAYMRGRTLDNAFVVLDEAQNTTPAQMKMFLTRIGFGSKAIITGDMTQKDLPEGARSGLDDALRVLRGIDEIGVCMLTSQDVVRHPLVQKIVSAYDADEKRREARNRARRADADGKKDKKDKMLRRRKKS